MKKRIAWICLVWILLSHVEVPYVSEWMHAVERGWMELLEEVAPFARVRLSSLAYVIALFVVTSEAFSKQSRTTPGILNLKKHSLSEGGRVLSLISKAPNNMTAASNDYLQDICFVERRFNGWLLICLVMLLVFGPAVFLIAETEAPAVGIPFVVIGIILLVIMLRGKLTVGTADGDVMSVLTNKITAEEVCTAITGADARGFHEVSLSSPFSEKTIHLRKSNITGVAALSRFPVLLFFLFLASAFGAFAVLEDAPFALIVPAILLGIVIFLARKQTTAKLIGGHYCFLGSRETTDNLLSVTTPEK